MALIKCPDCGNEVSEQAPTCPNCGRPLEDVSPKTQNVRGGKGEGCFLQTLNAGCIITFIIIGLIILLVIFSGIMAQ